MSQAETVIKRIHALGQISDEPGHLTRTFCSPAMRRASELVAGWMVEAGMSVREDAIGNLIGRYPAENPRAKTFLLGSHLDTVRHAGKFDGPLGVLTAIACIGQLHKRGLRLPFAIEVIAFSDEEGVRYQCAYLGSKVMAGKFHSRDLMRVDADGISMAEAISAYGGNPARLNFSRANPKELLGYVEVHIEQGPVLEKKNLAVGIVTGIAGQTRCRICFVGRAGHAGTTPMRLRKDALCAAAEFITGVESLAKKSRGLVATVGQIDASPGASNVIAENVGLSLDIRHQDDAKRHAAGRSLKGMARRIARKRGVVADWEVVQDTGAVPCSPALSKLLARAARNYQSKVLSLPSGAGHDAAVLASITPVAMLFVRCRGGVSHHPDESVKSADVRVALSVLNDFLQLLAQCV